VCFKRIAESWYERVAGRASEGGDQYVVDVVANSTGGWADARLDDVFAHMAHQQ
jgi:hypothetical protein